jgi:hypothetical protein
MEQLKECGARAAAMKQYQDGERHNPYRTNSQAWREFEAEWRNLEKQEFNNLMGWNHAS